MLKPVAAPGTSSAEEAGKKKPAPEASVPARSEKAGKSLNPPDWSKLLPVLLIAGGVILVVAALAAGSFFWYRSGRMPAALADRLAPVMKKFAGDPARPAPKKPAPKPASKPRVVVKVVPKPVAPPPPKTRPSYLAKLRKAEEMKRETPAEQREFLAAVDAIFAASVLGSDVPVTKEERDALVKLLELYAPVDEKVRFAPARAGFAAKLDAETARRREEAAALRRAEEEKRQAEARRIAEERRRAEEQLREAEAERRRLEALRRQEEQEQRRLVAERTARLRSMLNGLTRNIGKGFAAAVYDGNDKELAAAIAEAKQAEIPADCTSEAERKIIDAFRQFVNGIEEPARTLRSFVASVTKISEEDAVAIRYGNGMVMLHEVRPGILRGRSDSGIVDIKLEDDRVKRTFMVALMNYLATDPECGKLLPAKLKGVQDRRKLARLRQQNLRWCEFHFRLMNRDFSTATARLAPDAFWRRFFGMLKVNMPAK